MFNFFKPKPSLRGATLNQSNPEKITLHLSGLHCSSCAVNIDLALEDLPSVESKTNYQRSETKITYDPSQTNLESIKSAITDLGYQIY